MSFCSCCVSLGCHKNEHERLSIRHIKSVRGIFFIIHCFPFCCFCCCQHHYFSEYFEILLRPKSNKVLSRLFLMTRYDRQKKMYGIPLLSCTCACVARKKIKWIFYLLLLLLLLAARIDWIRFSLFISNRVYCHRISIYLNQLHLIIHWFIFIANNKCWTLLSFVRHQNLNHMHRK